MGKKEQTLGHIEGEGGGGQRTQRVTDCGLARNRQTF